MILKVEENFERRFKDLEFVLSNLTLVKEFAKIQEIGTAEQALTNLKLINQITEQNYVEADSEVVHTSIVAGGIRLSSEIVYLSETHKVKSLIDMQSKASLGCAYLAVSLSDKEEGSFDPEKIYTNFVKSAFRAGISSTAIQLVALGTRAKDTTEFYSALDRVANKLKEAN